MRKFLEGVPADASEQIQHITLDGEVTDRLPELAKCEKAYTGQVKYKNECGSEITDNFTFSDPRCLPITDPTPTQPPVPGTPVVIPGWTNQPVASCSTAQANGVEPAVPAACVDTISGLASGFVRLPYEGATEQQSRVYRNMNYNTLHSGSCQRDGSLGANDLPAMNPNEFYSFRFIARENSMGSVTFNSLGVGSITVSECPGDFGHIIEDGAYAIPNGSVQTGPQKTLHVYTVDSDANHNKVTPDRPNGLVGLDRCVFKELGGGTGATVQWHTNDSNHLGGCRLTPGKTYYLNLAPRHYQRNTPLNSINFRMTVSY